MTTSVDKSKPREIITKVMPMLKMAKTEVCPIKFIILLKFKKGGLIIPKIMTSKIIIPINIKNLKYFLTN